MASTRALQRSRSALSVDVALMAVALMWASTFVTFKVAWRDVDPVAFTGIRFAVMVVFSVVVLLFSGARRLPLRGDLRRIAAASLCGYFLYQMGFVLGLDRTSALASAILISTHPIFAVMFSWLSHRERPSRTEVAGVALGFFGVAVFLRFWNAFGAAQLGDLLSLGAAAAFGAYGVINQPLGKKYATHELMAYELVIGGGLTTLVAVPAMLHQDWGAVSGQSWLILAYAIVGPVYLAYALWNWAIGKRGIARTVVYAFLVPVLGGAMAVLFLNETVGPAEVAGAILVLAGLVVTRFSSRPAPPAPPRMPGPPSPPRRPKANIEPRNRTGATGTGRIGPAHRRREEASPMPEEPQVPQEPGTQTIDALFAEDRRYPPPPDFAARANAQPDIYERDPDEFWETEGRTRVSWSTPFEQLYEWDLPYAKWYLGGKLNACHNCVDRHVESGLGDKVAYHWEGEPEGDRRTITFADLQRQVVKAANGFRKLGIAKGTPVGIYMGMVPELPIAMLALARIGAPFTVVFGGFSADSLAGRLNDMECRFLVTQDGGYRRGVAVSLKRNADEALEMSPSVQAAVVVERTGSEVTMADGRDRWWHDVVDGESDDPASCPPEEMDSEDLLYLLYTSGTTAKPKGIVHTTGGYLVGAATTHHYIFDVKPDSVYWCAADIGWVTGHSYIVFGPLANATTGVMYEGTPDFPDKDRWWDIVERYKVDILYTAPTAIRTHMKWGPEFAEKHDLSSLRLLGTVGEPINPEAWMWYREHIGGGRTPVVDTWWQTETGMILITPLPGVTTLKPGSATKPFPGIQAAVYNDRGEEVAPGEGGGYLVLKRPWPAMLRGIYRDPDRFVETYWSRFPGVYFVGDGARQDEDGDLWLLGRVDDVMNVSAHRISTIEVESALVDHPAVAEAAVCGRADPTTGQAIVAFVTLKGGAEGSVEMMEELRDHVAKVIGPIAKPANIVFTPELPKTRSGKIMRRLLRDVAENRALGDTSTLADPTIVDELQQRAAVEAGKAE